jgi:citrate lyase gamma subunit
MTRDMEELEAQIEIEKTEGLQDIKTQMEANLELIIVSQYIERSCSHILNSIKTTLANCNINDKGDIKCTKSKKLK